MSDTHILDGRYTIGDLLGQGGMGAVYHGTDTANHQPVAIKRLKPELVAADPGTVERFAREGEALRRLNHPNIVKVLATLEADGQHYIVMEYVDGGSLYDLLQHQPQLPVNRALAIVLELADALTRAHHLKIIHRDIKPANVLIATDGTPRLTDFGVAQIGSEKRLTQTGAAVGTPDYLSPEALNGEAVDTRSDIWAFGVMLFEMLAGKRPFHSDNLTGVLGAILTKPVPDLEALRPDVPVALVDLIYRMLEKDRHQRLPSVRQVGAELENILQGRDTSSVGARHASPAQSAFATPTPSTDADADKPRHNLPIQTTPFVGRETELAELAKLLNNPNTRLITILAPGGMGKTRLALATAQTLLDAGNSPPYRYAEGSGVGFVSPSPLAGRGSGGGVKNVYFVPLAPLTSPDFIVSAIADAVGFQFYPGGEPKQQLLDYFREKSMLLVLDNFEHVLDGAGIVSDILNHAPGIRVLATSRERLNLSGETLFALSGMDFPDWETPEDALNYAAVKLFMQSARRARADFELVGDDLTYLARICQLVAGMPLGVVLAAAWVEMLSLKEIADEIAQSLDFLETELRDIPERQRSIRGVFEYSWQRLSEDERSVFKKLSVFRGGFTREAAQSVAGASLKTLAALVNKSLLRRDPNTGRYEVHELLRQYGEQWLNEADSNQVKTVHDRYAAYYVSFAEKAEKEFRGPQQTFWFHQLKVDYDNLRAALAWSLEKENTEFSARLAASLGFFWTTEGPQTEGYQWTERILERLENIPPTLLAKLFLGAGLLSFTQRQSTQGKNWHRQALEISRDLGDRLNIAWSLILLSGQSIGQLDEYQEAVALCEEGVALFRELNEKKGLAQGLNILEELTRLYGDYPKAKAYCEECIAISRETGEVTRVAMNLANLSFLNHHQGDYQQAGDHAKEGLLIYAELKSPSSAALCLIALAGAVVAQGQPERAAHLLGASEALLEAADVSTQPGDQHELDRYTAAVRQQLDPKTFETEWAKGRAMTFEEIVRYALEP